MAKLPANVRSAGSTVPDAARLPLPDPKSSGPFRPFTCDPGWSEAWWWLGIPLAVGLFVVATYWINPAWHRHWVTREGPGVLETGQFILMVIGFAIAVQLWLAPFVRRRPVVLTVTIVSALACFYIAGEEVSWGQHIFFWEDPALISETNDEGEFSLHNVNKVFERVPRAGLELGVLFGGLIVPLICLVVPRLRQSRAALFLPSAMVIPTALFAAVFKIDGTLSKYTGESVLSARSSEAVEFYLYFFILAYLVVFERRIHALETENHRRDDKALSTLSTKRHN